MSLRAGSVARAALLAGAFFCLGSAAAHGSQSIRTVEEYLAAFDQRYETPAAEHDSVALADAALHRAESWWWPRLSLREELRAGANGPVLDLSLSSTMVVYDATSVPDIEVAHADLALRTAVAEQARVGATAAFLHDVIAYAVLVPARDLARAAVAASGGDQESPDPLALPPSQRGPFEASISEIDGARWLEGAVRDVEERLAHTLAVPLGSLSAPALEDAIALAGKSVARVRGLRYAGRDGPSGNRAGVASLATLVARCVDRAPATRVAHARHALTLSRERASRATDFVLQLVASADHSLALNGAAPGSPLTATVGLQASIDLPDGWPVAGSLRASVDLSGASQSAELSWPPTTKAALHEPNGQAVLADETKAATWDARALWQAYEQAKAERDRRERALAWAVLDAYPALSIMKVKSLSAQPLSADWHTTDAGADMALTRPRIEAALAHLGQLAAATDLAAFCGALPAAPRG